MTDVIILAGGAGTRLREVVSDVPKPLARVGDRPFLDLLLSQLARQGGVARVVLATGHRAEAIESYYRTAAADYPFEILCSRETQPLGTGGAARLALDATTTSDVIVMNGDSYLEFSLATVGASLAQTNGVGVVVVTQVPDTSAFGRVTIDPITRRITVFTEKGSAGGAGWINGGGYGFRREALAEWRSGLAFSLEREVLPALLPRGIEAVEATGRFIDIGTPASYAAAPEVLHDLLSRIG